MADEDITWNPSPSGEDSITWNDTPPQPRAEAVPQHEYTPAQPGSFRDRQHAFREGLASEPRSVGAGTAAEPSLNTHNLRRTIGDIGTEYSDVGRGLVKGAAAATIGWGVAGDIEQMGRKFFNQTVKPEEQYIPPTTSGGILSRPKYNQISPAKNENEALGMGLAASAVPIPGLKRLPEGLGAVRRKMGEYEFTPPLRDQAAEKIGMQPKPPEPTPAPGPAPQPVIGEPSSEVPFELHPQAPRATVRPDTGFSALPPDVPHTLPPGAETVVPRGLGRPSAGAESISSTIAQSSPETIAELRRQLAQDGWTEATIDAKIEELSQHHVLAEVSDNMKANLQKLGKYAGESKNTIEGTLSTREAEEAERIKNIRKDVFGDPINLAQKRRAIDAERRARSNPFWKDFETRRISPTPEIEALQPRLQAAGALAEAKKMAAIRGEKWANVYPQGEGKVAVPTAKSWQLVKEALDAKIEGAKNTFGGHTKRSIDLTKLKNDMIDAIDKHPDSTIADVWKEARNTWAGPEQIKSAQKLGWSLLDEKIDPHELPYTTSRWSKADYEAALEGAGARFERMAGRKGKQNLNQINTMLAPNVQEKLQFILNKAYGEKIGQKKFDDMLRSMEHERSMHAKKDEYTGRTQTALRTAEDDPFKAKIPGVEKIANFAGHAADIVKNPKGAAAQFAYNRASKAAKAKAEVQAEKLRNEMARIYMLQGPERDATLRWLVSQPYKLTVHPERPRAHGGRVNADNINHSPTEAQKESGNYAKDHVRIHGLDIAIENAKGHHRRGVGRDGKAWSVKMPAHYGYIKGTVGKDKDHVDVYVGPHVASGKVYVVDQHNADSGVFDEHKAFIGFGSANQARLTYQRGFSDGRGHERLGHMAEMSVQQFKDWLSHGTQKPAKHVSGKETHIKVGYQTKSTHTGHCSACSMFVAPASCTAVKSPIWKGGWCKLFEAKPGSGAVTRELQKHLSDPQIPAIMSKLDRSPMIRQAALDRFNRDAEYATKLGDVTRPDIQRARKLIAEGGFTALFNDLKKGGALPVALLPVALGALGAVQNSGRGE